MKYVHAVCRSRRRVLRAPHRHLRQNTNTRDEVVRREMRRAKAAGTTPKTQPPRKQRVASRLFLRCEVDTPAVQGTTTRGRRGKTDRARHPANLTAGVGLFHGGEGILSAGRVQSNIFGTANARSSRSAPDQHQPRLIRYPTPSVTTPRRA